VRPGGVRWSARAHSDHHPINPRMSIWKHAATGTEKGPEASASMCVSTGNDRGQGQHHQPFFRDRTLRTFTNVALTSYLPTSITSAERTRCQIVPPSGLRLVVQPYATRLARIPIPVPTQWTVYRSSLSLGAFRLREQGNRPHQDAT
jgi:hypothetical protein